MCFRCVDLHLSCPFAFPIISLIIACSLGNHKQNGGVLVLPIQISPHVLTSSFSRHLNREAKRLIEPLSYNLEPVVMNQLATGFELTFGCNYNL
ncbi:hypothetical protein Hanom_Chr16g01471351 [Helianthus anomalus]